LPVYQNVTATVSSPEEIKKNLIIQLTSKMDAISTTIADGATLFTEVGPGKY
jgi:malonyl CoA-acyl carrier protein transacylase